MEVELLVQKVTMEKRGLLVRSDRNAWIVES